MSLSTAGITMSSTSGTSWGAKWSKSLSPPIVIAVDTRHAPCCSCTGTVITFRSGHLKEGVFPRTTDHCGTACVVF